MQRELSWRLISVLYWKVHDPPKNMRGETSSWEDELFLCVPHSTGKKTTPITATVASWHIIWQLFHINKRGQYCEVPALLLVVVWQLCTPGSISINQWARALPPAHSLHVKICQCKGFIDRRASRAQGSITGPDFIRWEIAGLVHSCQVV